MKEGIKTVVFVLGTLATASLTIMLLVRFAFWLFHIPLP